MRQKSTKNPKSPNPFLAVCLVGIIQMHGERKKRIFTSHAAAVTSGAVSGVNAGRRAAPT